MTTRELRKHIIVSLLSIKPQGEEAFWRTLEECDPETQVRLLLEAVVPFDLKLPPEKLNEAALRLLRSPLTDKSLRNLTAVVQPETPAAAELTKALKAAFAQYAPGDRQRMEVMWNLSRLKDPETDALSLAALSRRGAESERRRAIGMLRRQKSPEALRLALSIANSDFELYSMRYSALRAVEKYNPALARQIALKWTRDWRYRLRDCGRTLLAGEEKGYL